MHLTNSALLFLVIQFTEMIYCLNMADVCSADDDKCKKPNLSGVGMIEKGICSWTGVLLRFRQLSLLECAKECFITSQCTSINYRKNWKLCDLVMSETDGNKIANDSTCIKSNITTWKKSLAGNCADHNCEEGQKCECNADDNRFKCVEAYCKGLPNTPHAAVDERFGLRRNLGTGNKYKCKKGYKMEGTPFAVCQSPGHWKVLFNCTTKVDACSAKGYEYNMTMKTCIKLKADKSNWDNARKTCQRQPDGDLVSITTKEKWDVIIKYLEESGFKNGKIWIGLKDKKWMTGNVFENVFDIPDITGAVFKKSCGVIKKNKNGMFTTEEEECAHKEIFLCEILII
ncbi:uncharacterized protein LOC127721942 [Mytilus californianus]|uniref:uncharacterized protein LOC127721942 n=1 Tax=Mytilus californianus TaxID=6549 RepID=UPI0022471E17|nr:uncharacterized protein LOC127721942 [Mytilus californianus]